MAEAELSVQIQRIPTPFLVQARCASGEFHSGPSLFLGGTPEIGAPLRVGFRSHALASHSLLPAPGLRTYGRRLAFTGAGARPKSPIAAPASDGVNGAIGLPFGGKSEHEL